MHFVTVEGFGRRILMEAVDLLPVSALQMERFQEDKETAARSSPASAAPLIGSLPHRNRGDYPIAQVGGIF